MSVPLPSYAQNLCRTGLAGLIKGFVSATPLVKREVCIKDSYADLSTWTRAYQQWRFYNLVEGNIVYTSFTRDLGYLSCEVINAIVEDPDIFTTDFYQFDSLNADDAYNVPNTGFMYLGHCVEVQQRRDVDDHFYYLKLLDVSSNKIKWISDSALSEKMRLAFRKDFSLLSSKEQVSSHAK